MNTKETKEQIRNLIERFSIAKRRNEYKLLSHSITSGKLYEAHVLSLVVKKLAVVEGFNITLVNSQYIPLKSAPGPINRDYPHFELRREGMKVAEIWTDVEFTALSYERSMAQRQPNRGEYHELDILVTDTCVDKRPTHKQVWLGIECKNSGYTKKLLREILGIRRELSYLKKHLRTKFIKWPVLFVPADPPSCLMVFSTDGAVREYSSPGKGFGVEFVHERI